MRGHMIGNMDGNKYWHDNTYVDVHGNIHGHEHAFWQLAWTRSMRHASLRIRLEGSLCPASALRQEASASGRQRAAVFCCSLREVFLDVFPYRIRSRKR